MDLHGGLSNICEVGMKEAIYEEAFENLDLVKFLAGVRDLILQQTLFHHYGTLVSMLKFLVALETTVQQAAQSVTNLRETEHRRARHNVRSVEGIEYFQLLKLGKLPHRYPNQAPYGCPRNMFSYLIWARVAFAKVDRQLNHFLLQLWK